MTVLLWVDSERGALARILLVAERRGFRTTQMVATPIRDGSGFLVQLAVEGARDPSTLQRMLARLHDVRRVMLEPAFERDAEAS